MGRTKAKYRIFPINEVPSDLRNSISQIHANALLQAKNEDNTPGGPRPSTRREQVAPQRTKKDQQMDEREELQPS
jgi:hypothetical protein